MRQTDDFLSDLEAQLRTARPRRDPRPLLILVAVSIVAIAILALAAGGGERASVPAADPPADVRVAVLNATTTPRLATRVTDSLRRAGYPVVPPGDYVDQARAQSVVAARDEHHRAAARALAKRLGIDKVITGGTAFDLSPGADVAVVLGLDRPRILVLNASGLPHLQQTVRRRLERQGMLVLETEASFGDHADARTTYESVGSDTGPARLVTRALGQPDAHVQATFGSGYRGNVVVYAGRDLSAAAEPDIGRIVPQVRIAVTRTGGDARVVSRIRERLGSTRATIVSVESAGRPLSRTYVEPVNAGTLAQARRVARRLGVRVGPVDKTAYEPDKTATVLITAGRELSGLPRLVLSTQGRSTPGLGRLIDRLERSYAVTVIENHRSSRSPVTRVVSENPTGQLPKEVESALGFDVVAISPPTSRHDRQALRDQDVLVELGSGE